MKDQTKELRLSDILPGQRAFVEKINAGSDMKKRFIDIGLIGGTEVECVGVSPLGDPKAYLIRSAVIAIRRCDGCEILVGGGDAT